MQEKVDMIWHGCATVFLTLSATSKIVFQCWIFDICASLKAHPFSGVDRMH